MRGVVWSKEKTDEIPKNFKKVGIPKKSEDFDFELMP